MTLLSRGGHAVRITRTWNVKAFALTSYLIESHRNTHLQNRAWLMQHCILRWLSLD